MTDRKQANRPAAGFSGFSRSRGNDLFAKAGAFAKQLRQGRMPGFETCQCPVVEYHGGRALIDTGTNGLHEVIVMCSADYLGFAHHPEMIRTLRNAAKQYGVSVASVPLMAGATQAHEMLRQRLACFLGQEDVVLFPTGYAANTGAIAALCAPGDAVIVDELIHHSVLDGIRLSGAHRLKFHHSNPDHLRAVLAKTREKYTGGILVVLEGVYGTDGDIAPLPELMATARAYQARVMVDDAHATGVLGLEGQGSAAHFGGLPTDIIMGSLSKALGGTGGWLACSAPVAHYLRHFAKAVVVSVGFPAAWASAGCTAIDLLHDEPQWMIRLHENSAFFRQALMTAGLKGPEHSNSAIISLLAGGESRLRRINQHLFERGVWAEPLPFPLAPKGEERIRFRISARHTRRDLSRTVEVIQEAFNVHTA